jgi:hypothetical protein
MKAIVFAAMFLFVVGFATATENTCFDVRACVDGSDWVTVDGGHLTLAHNNYQPIGSPGDCPEDYWNVIFIDDQPISLTYHDGQYWQGDAVFDVPVSLEGIDTFTKNFGRGDVTQDGNTLYIDDNDEPSGDIYSLNICGPQQQEVPEFGLIAGMVAVVGAAGAFIILRRK